MLVYFYMFLFFFWSTVAWAEPKRVAVLEFRGVAQEQILIQISDEARGGVREGLPRQKYTITSRENIKQILEDMGKTLEDCSTECEITLGRDVGADYVLSGSLFVMEGTYVLNIKLHDTYTGSLLAQKRIQDRSVINLLSKTNVVTRTLAEEEIMGTAVSGSANKVSVRFESQPAGEGVTVQVAGELICTKTPCEGDVPVGRHQVRFQRKEYFTWKEDVVLEEGKTVRAELKSKFALLTVDTSPRGLDVFLDNKKQSDFQKRKMTPDTYEIWVKDKCFVDEGMEIKLEPGVDELLTFHPLSRASGVDVEVYDARENAVVAKLFVDDRYVGDSPFRGEVPLCAKKLRAEYGEKKTEIPLSLKEQQIKPIKVQIR